MVTSEIMGKSVAGYTITDLLGEGGMGIVYKAHDPNLDRYVALKVMDPHLARNQAFMKRFRNEAKALAQLDNSHIVKVHSLIDTELGVCIVMEFVKGRTLGQIIAGEGPLPLKRLFNLFDKVLDAFEHAHDLGIVHRDIKPSNIIVTDNDEVKVADFGLAKIFEPSGTTVTQTSGGTIYYMSPEQIEGLGKVDKRGDIYSIGMTMFESMTGAVPFEKTDSDFTIRERIMKGKIRPPRDVNPNIPKSVNDFILKALHKDIDRRFQNAGEMRIALERIRTEEREKSTPLNGESQKRSFAFTSKTVVGALLVVAVVAGGIVLVNILSVKNGTVTIHTTPARAHVSIEDRDAGESPISQFEVPPGDVRVHLQKENYEPFDTTLTVREKEPSTLTVNLRERRISNVPTPSLRSSSQIVPIQESVPGAGGLSQKEKPIESASEKRQRDVVKKPAVPQRDGNIAARQNELAKVELRKSEPAPIAHRKEEKKEPERSKPDESVSSDIVNKQLVRLRDEYISSLENRDIGALTRLLQLSGAEESGWEKFFEKARDIKVTVDQYAAKRSGANTAEVTFKAVISYFNTTLDETSNQSIQNRWDCEYQGEKWSIVSRQRK